MAQLLFFEPNGGGPLTQHTHAHAHLFIVVEGEAKILLGGAERVLHLNESFFVDGNIPHAVWNNINGVTRMIGISIKK